eukprot:NODE_9_length_47730_cov_0.323718.p11 type:complete len:329 gc:universal NODE_9_length_47730_cov_0.323718:26820-27806(+)
MDFIRKKLSGFWWPSDNLVIESETKLLNMCSIPYSIELVELSEKKYINTFRIQSKTEDKSLVMTHGFGAGLAYYFLNFPSLSTLAKTHGMSVYAIDWLGMGRSSRNAINSYDIKSVENYFIDALEEWRVKLRIRKMILLGHSFGGYLSVAYSLKYPEHVEKLILISPVGFSEKPMANPRSHPKWIELCWYFNITPQLLLRFLGPFGKILVSNMAKNRFMFLNNEQLEHIKDYMLHINMNTGAGEFAMNPLLMPGAYARDPLIHRFRNIRCPTAFIYGKTDWIHTSAAYSCIESHPFPDLHNIQICNGGHFMFLDNSEEFNSLLINILV